MTVTGESRTRRVVSNAQQLSVDWLRCDGHGLCAEVAPELIALDDWGYPIILKDVTVDTERVGQKAVTLCPALALRLRPRK